MGRATVLTFIALILSGGQQKTTDTDNYYLLKNIHSLAIGSLKFTDVKVSTATPGSFDRSSGEQVVAISFENAHVTLLSDSSGMASEVFSGDLAEGTVDAPAASIKGRITWSNKSISRFYITDLTLRLKSFRISTVVGGSNLSVQPTSTAIVTNNSPAIGDQNNAVGSLSVSIFRSKLAGLKLNLSGLPLTADFAAAGHDPTVLDISLDRGVARIKSGLFSHPGNLSTNISEPLKTFFPNEELEAGRVNLSNITIEWQESTPAILVQRMTVSRPQISVNSYSIPVHAALELDALNIRDAVPGDSQDLVTAVPLSIDQYRIKSDYFGLLNELNLAGKYAQPDALVPTGDPIVRYSKASALAQFYKHLAEAQRSSSDSSIDRVFLHSDGLVITGSTSNRVEVPKRGASVEGHSICVVVDKLTDVGSTALVGELLATVTAPEVVGPYVIARWLSISTASNPELGVGFAYRVASASVYLSDPLTQKAIKFGTGNVTGSLANRLCELILEKGLPPQAYKLIGTNPPDYVLYPKLFANIQNPPSDLYSNDFYTRYRAYMTNIVPKPITPAERRILKLLENSEHTAMNALETTDRQNVDLVQEHAVRVERQEEALRSSEQQSRARTLEVMEQDGVNNAQEAAAESARQEEQRQQDQRKFSQGTSNPGTTTPGPTPDPTPDVKLSIQAKPE